PLVPRNGLLIDELCDLDSDQNSIAVSNDAVGRIIIAGLDRGFVAVITLVVHRPEQFLDNAPFLNLPIRTPIPKRSILPAVPNHRVEFVAYIVATHLCALTR